MVGGIVTEVIVLPDKVWINCVESREKCDDHCAIYVERNDYSEAVKPGDSVWWQGADAMWTPYGRKIKHGGKGGLDCDIRIPRIGFSGASRPELQHA